MAVTVPLSLGFRESSRGFIVVVVVVVAAAAADDDDDYV